MAIPRADEAERAVVGGALSGLCSPEVLQRVLAVVRPADFAHPTLQAIWAAIGGVAEVGHTATVIAVIAEMRARGSIAALSAYGGEPHLAELANAASTVEPILRDACEVRRVGLRREQLRLAALLQERLQAGQEAEQLPQQIAELRAQELAVGRPTAPAVLPTVPIGQVADPGPARWLVQDLWVSGAFGFCGAEPKSWKSWVTLTLALSVASGRPAFGRYVVEPGPVLLLSVEGGKGLARRRLGQLARAHDVDLSALPIALIDVDTLRLDEPEQAAALVATVGRLRPVLLVLDPLRELHGGDENDSALISRLLAPLRQIQHQTECAVIVVHHSAKSPGEGWRGRRGGQRLRGSSALHGASDSALYLSAEGEGERKRVTVSAEHRAAIEPAAFTLAMRERTFADGQGLWLEIVEEEPETRAERDAEARVGTREKVRAEILRVVRLAAMPGRTPLSSKRAVATAAKARVTVVGALIDELLEEGRLVAGKRGALRVVDLDDDPTGDPAPDSAHH